MNDGYIKIMAASIIWGTLGIFARWSCSDPLNLAFFRCFVAALFLFWLLYRRPGRLPVPGGKTLLLVCGSGLFNAAGNLCFFTALSLTTLSQTLFVYYLGPVFLVALAPLCLKEKLEIKSMLALFIALGGFLLILFSSPDLPLTTEVKGLMFALAGAVCFAFIFIIAKAVPDLDGLTLAFYQMLVTAICLFPFVTLSPDITAGAVGCFVVLGVVHTAIAYSIYYQGLKQVKIQHAGILLYLDPVVGTVVGYLLFREALHSYGFLGGILIILAGIIVVTGRSVYKP